MGAGEGGLGRREDRKMTSFPELTRDQLEAMLMDRNQDIERLLTVARGSLQFLHAWLLEYPQPGDPQRARIEAQIVATQLAIWTATGSLKEHTDGDAA